MCIKSAPQFKYIDTTIHRQHNSLTKQYIDNTIRRQNNSQAKRNIDKTIHGQDNSLTQKFKDKTIHRQNISQTDNLNTHQFINKENVDKRKENENEKRRCYI